jgi:hypothetical protein
MLNASIVSRVCYLSRGVGFWRSRSCPPRYESYSRCTKRGGDQYLGQEAVGWGAQPAPVTKGGRGCSPLATVRTREEGAVVGSPPPLDRTQGVKPKRVDSLVRMKGLEPSLPCEN